MSDSPTKRKRHTSGFYKKIIEDYEKGIELRVLAKKYGFTYNHMRCFFINNGYDMSESYRKKLTPKEVEEREDLLLKLMKKRLSIDEILQDKNFSDLKRYKLLLLLSEACSKYFFVRMGDRFYSEDYIEKLSYEYERSNNKREIVRKHSISDGGMTKFFKRLKMKKFRS
ncbi:MAG: hypothetical protein HC932_00040 [Thermales bacterium]|nr:hypothetical protein [Thermales bacterium]